MQKKNWAFALLALAAIGCEAAPTATRPQPGGAPRMADMVDDAEVPLSVTVIGSNKVLREATVNYRADVTGGSGSYYYQWVAEVCYTDGYCRAPMTFAEGAGVSSVQRLIRSDEAEVNIAVQVREDAAVHYSGVDDLRVLGPATWNQGPVSSTWGCRAPTQFPHTDWRQKDGNWTPYKYARGCDGRKVEQPTS